MIAIALASSSYSVLVATVATMTSRAPVLVVCPGFLPVQPFSRGVATTVRALCTTAAKHTHTSKAIAAPLPLRYWLVLYQ